MGHLDVRARRIGESDVVRAGDVSYGAYDGWRYTLCHIFAAEDAEARDLHAMLAFFEDKDDWPILGLALGDNFAGADLPGLEYSVYGRVPGTETRLWLSLGVRGIVKRVAEETRSSLDDRVSSGVDGDDLDRVRKGLREEQFSCARGHACR
jgi:hypothetical protein